MKIFKFILQIFSGQKKVKLSNTTIQPLKFPIIHRYHTITLLYLFVNSFQKKYHIIGTLLLCSLGHTIIENVSCNGTRNQQTVKLPKKRHLPRKFNDLEKWIEKNLYRLFRKLCWQLWKKLSQVSRLSLVLGWETSYTIYDTQITSSQMSKRLAVTSLCISFRYTKLRFKNYTISTCTYLRTNKNSSSEAANQDHWLLF